MEEPKRHWYVVFPIHVETLAEMMQAIWDNRCVFHTGTSDYQGLGDRMGIRAVGVGEAPYLKSSAPA